MEISKLLAIMRRELIMLFCIMLVSVTSEDGQTGPSGTGLLCISECGTCPVICSTPPPPLNTEPQQPPSPLVHHYPPPESYNFNFPPPTETQPLLPLLPTPPPPPESYNSWGATPPPVNNIPTVQTPPGMGQRNYSYPYFYFYASKASSFPLQGSSIFMLLLAFHALYFCW